MENFNSLSDLDKEQIIQDLENGELSVNEFLFSPELQTPETIAAAFNVYFENETRDYYDDYDYDEVVDADTEIANNFLKCINADQLSPELCLAMVQKDGMLLKIVPENMQNPEICLAAVQNDGLALRFVKERTHEINMAAVRSNAYAIRFVKVKDKTDDICIAAVQRDGYALQYIQHQTDEICLAAVKENGEALQFVKNQTPEICLAAVQRDGEVLKYVKEQTDEICLAAVQKSGRALEYVQNQTPEICLVALQNDPLALEYVKDKTPTICAAALRGQNEKQQEKIMKYIPENIQKIAKDIANGKTAFSNKENYEDKLHTLIVHNGTFHADDAMVAALAQTANPNVKILRLSNQELDKYLENPDPGTVVADIGYGKYDHHQADAERRENGEKYAACGLFLRDFWKGIFPNEEAYKAFDENIIQPIEQQDNGGPSNPLSMAVSSFMPGWGSVEKPDQAFDKAVGFLKDVVTREIEKSLSKEKAKDYVLDALHNSDGKVVVLDQFAPWQDVLKGDRSEAEFVAFPSIRDPEKKQYNIQCVPTGLPDRSNKVPIPQEWLENRPEGCTFVHQGRFMATFQNRELAIQAAREIVEQNREKQVVQENEKPEEQEIKPDLNSKEYARPVVNDKPQTQEPRKLDDIISDAMNKAKTQSQGKTMPTQTNTVDNNIEY